MIDTILDMWNVGYDLPKIMRQTRWSMTTVRNVLAIARRQRDPRAGIQRLPNGRFLGGERVAARILVLYPQIRIIEVPFEMLSRRDSHLKTVTVFSRQQRARMAA